MEQDRELMRALDTIPVSELDYMDWIAVGMALKEKGYPCDLWDGWSKADSRYKAGECQRKWNGFRGEGTKAGTIVEIARRFGYVPERQEPMDWDSVIEDDWEPDPYDDVTQYSTAIDELIPKDQIRRYLALFQPNEYVSFAFNARPDKEGKWHPVDKGVSIYTAAELLERIDRFDDLEMALTGYNPEAGGWIRFNPVTQGGSKNEDVTAFRFALVESDSMPTGDQEAMIRKLQLPVAMLVHSGGKSLHALVRVDADSYEEYRKRVNYLYDRLEREGMALDKQNRNPARLSRLPGLRRGYNWQYIVAENIGKKSWQEWVDWIEGANDDLPETIRLSDVFECPPPERPALIDGVLRQGHKMLIAGPSKAGKSFLLMQLALSVAHGREWLGFGTKKSPVLYMNMEIDSASCIRRFISIQQELDIKEASENVHVLNLRGKTAALAEMKEKIVRRVMTIGPDGALIIDPIYKLMTGDENAAGDIVAFWNIIDEISERTGWSVIVAHHFSKGTAGAKKSIDRASGSGVFARDPDALFTLTPLTMDEATARIYADKGAAAFRGEFTLREFREPKPLNIWFTYPRHELDQTGALEKLYEEGDSRANLKNQSSQKKEDEIKAAIIEAYARCEAEDPGFPVQMAKLVKESGRQQGTIETYIGGPKLSDYFEIVRKKEGKNTKVYVVKKPVFGEF